MSICIDQNKCVGCGACTEVCPGNLIFVSPLKQTVEPEKNSVTARKVARLRDVRDCWGCTACVKACRRQNSIQPVLNSALKIIDGCSEMSAYVRLNKRRRINCPKQNAKQIDSRNLKRRAFIYSAKRTKNSGVSAGKDSTVLMWLAKDSDHRSVFCQERTALPKSRRRVLYRND